MLATVRHSQTYQTIFSHTTSKAADRLCVGNVESSAREISVYILKFNTKKRSHK